MLFSVVIFAFAVFTDAAPSVRPAVSQLNGRIVGGQETTIDKHPYQASFEYFSAHICGASILTINRVLTAAHCTYEVDVYYITIRVGTSYLQNGGTIMEVEAIYQHPKYDDETLEFDVSVVALKKNLEFGSNVKPILLHGVNEEVATGTMGTITGWGRTCSTCPFSFNLLESSLPKVSDEQCKMLHTSEYITESMICFGYLEGGKDTCQGDSGGPLIAEGTQVGIVSWGIGCADPNSPGVYTKVAHVDVQTHIKTYL